jgi:3-methyladenine DNA glycosylase/8-oxoguanine DNA glycosylase
MSVRAWGAGAAWALEQAPTLLGERSGELDDLASRPNPVPEMRRLHTGLRFCRTETVTETMLPFILEQKVTGIEAKRSWFRLATAWGEPAPGPAASLGLRIPPDPARLAEEPYWRLHRFGIERKRADTIRLVARMAPRLEEAIAMQPAEARRRMEGVPGIGPWTSSLVAQAALADHDAVVVGDYNFPHAICFTLLGQRVGTDELMVELLEPYRPWRGLAQRLILRSGTMPPRRAPHAQLRDLRAI